MGQSRVITIKVNEVPIQISIDAEQEELYRRAETELREMHTKMANAFGKTNSVQVLSALAYELMIKRLKLQDEIEAIEPEMDKTLSKEGRI